jgi:beta-galactosidase
VGTGAKRTIFWCLNPRLKGTEAGEWALLDYQYKPSDRLFAANQVAKILKKDAGFWANAEPQLPQVYLVQSKETMFQQQRAKQNAGDNIGRSTRAHKDAVLGTYLALQASGINPQLKDVPTMPWLNKDGKKKLAILPDASTITEAELQDMISFVQNGNTLILSGVTGMFDQHESLRYTQKSLLNMLIGAEVKQIVDFTIKGQKKSFRILLNREADKALSKIYKDSVWTNTLGKGKVIVTGAIGGLDYYHYPESSKWLALLTGFTNEAIRFERNNPNCYMRVMKSGNDLATIITNNSTNLTSVDLVGLENRKPILVAGKAKMKLQGNLWSVELPEAETVVIKWQ